MKKLLCALTAVLMLTAFSVPALAEVEEPFDVAPDGTLIKFYPSSYSATDVVIPDQVNGIVITKLDNGAFAGCAGVTSVTIPEGVTSIGNSAFFDCQSLKLITIPNSVASIGEAAFENCFELQPFKLPSGVTAIEKDVFSSCRSFGNFEIPISVKTIGEGAFAGCGLTEMTVPESVTSIGNEAFLGCMNLKSVTIPGSVTSMGAGVFYKCVNLNEVIFKGNAPKVNSDYLGFDLPSTYASYYYPGATGFADEWCGYPAKQIGGETDPGQGTPEPQPSEEPVPGGSDPGQTAPDHPSETAPDQTVSTDPEIRTDNGMLFGFTAGTPNTPVNTAAEVIDRYRAAFIISSDNNIGIYKDDNAELGADGTVGTGMIIKVIVPSTGAVTSQYPIIITGDIMGTGRASVGGFAKVGSSLLGIGMLNELQSAAADINGDGGVTIGDFALLGKMILGV